jgi:hypothetical protein
MNIEGKENFSIRTIFKIKKSTGLRYIVSSLGHLFSDLSLPALKPVWGRVATGRIV